MRSKNPQIISLRVLRKASHISGSVARKSGHFLERVEHKTSRIIINKSGSITGESSLPLSELLHHSYPYLTPVHPALPMVGQRPSVTVFAFLDPRGFYGGIATLLIVGAALANKLGYDFRVAQTTGFSKRTPVLEFLRSNGIDIPEDRFSTLDLSYRTPSNFAYLPMHPDDTVLVSAWWDAHVASMLPLPRKFIYLIQDYEPIFYNNSDARAFADQTYLGENFIPICNTELLHSFFAEKGYSYIQQQGIWFEPAPAPKVDKSAPAPPAQKRRLFLYGRPSVHRNLFFSALQAIDKAFQNETLRSQDWEIISAGQSDIPSIKLSSGLIVKNLGKMDLDKYYRFASGIDVAVSPMMAPHPNYPTLEFASLGAMVVSTKYETKQDLGQYSKNILLADATIDDMADKIVQACMTPREKRLENLKHNHIGGDWQKTLKQPVEELAKRIRVDKSDL
jgi:O-antigen biosynthesis protein